MLTPVADEIYVSVDVASVNDERHLGPIFSSSGKISDSVTKRKQNEKQCSKFAAARTFFCDVEATFGDDIARCMDTLKSDSFLRSVFASL